MYSILILLHKTYKVDGAGIQITGTPIDSTEALQTP
jgi:hypothetical protein